MAEAGSAAAVRAGSPRWLAALDRRPALAALGAGAIATLALPPVGFWPALLAVVPLLHLLQRSESRGRAFVLGWSFGVGHFLAGLYWIGIAFFVEAERFGLLAVPAVLLLSAGLALFPGLVALALASWRWRSGAALALAFALAWLGSELLRGHLFTGFPWNLAGYAFIDTPLAQLAAVHGVYGLSLLGMAAAASFLPLLDGGTGRVRFLPPLLVLLLVAAGWGGGAWRLAGSDPAPVPGVTLRLVQGNVAQHHKWEEELRARWFERHLELSREDPGDVTHVIWPESATPYALERDAGARRMIAEAVPEGGLLLTGGERFDLESTPARAWNSLFVLDPQGAVVARYDKAHLVPFGEFLPLRDLVGRLGLGTLTRGSIDFHPGPGPRTLAVPGLPPFSPLICYEVIFPGRVVGSGERPEWLLNVTNDSWFGRSSGPYQHLAMARMRAIEEGLPLVRAANTGISAVIDPLGRIEARLGLDRTGILDAALPRPLATPPVFARFGHLPLAGLALALALLALALELRAARATAKVNKS